MKHIDQVKTGLRGVAYLRLGGEAQPEWSSFLKEMPHDLAPAGM
jgi:hypothetical protein